MLGRVVSVVRPLRAAAAPALRRTVPQQTLRAFASTADLLPTPLNALHKELGGKMVDFCGYELPIQYEGEGIKQSHLHVREKAGLFDVSHMGQLRIYGKDRVDFLESLVVADLKELPEGSGTLSLIINNDGGIMDDCVITAYANHHYWVINAGRKHVDLPHIHARHAEFIAQGKDVTVEVIEDHALLALQGPEAARILQKHVSEDLSRMAFMTGKPMEVDGVPCLVTRCGYTGEDGFEISIPEAKVNDMFRTFTSDADCKPAGLGARDSLRLEAGLCLYGNDLDDTTTPAEGVLMWTVGKRQRVEQNFTAADKVMTQFKDKSAARKRIGLTVTKGAPARQGAEVVDGEGNKVGVVTSGTMSPTLGKPIAMAYVTPGLTKAGTELGVVVRGKRSEAVVTKMPFVPANYFKPE